MFGGEAPNSGSTMVRWCLPGGCWVWARFDLESPAVVLRRSRQTALEWKGCSWARVCSVLAGGVGRRRPHRGKTPFFSKSTFHLTEKCTSQCEIKKQQSM